MTRGAWLGLAAALLFVQGLHATESFEQIRVTDPSTPSAFTTTLISPDGQPAMVSASCRVRSGEVSVTYDGTTPSTGIGMLIQPGEVLWLPGHDRLTKFRAVPTGPIAQLDCTYSTITIAPERVEILTTPLPRPAAPISGPALALPACNLVRQTQCAPKGF